MDLRAIAVLSFFIVWGGFAVGSAEYCRNKVMKMLLVWLRFLNALSTNITRGNTDSEREKSEDNKTTPEDQFR
jgi:hypothetical protein